MKDLKERELIECSNRGPVTAKMLIRDLHRLGLRPGMTINLHISLSSLGWVLGGPQTVIQGIKDILTNEGTFMMATYTGWNSAPEKWSSPPVPKDWIKIIRDQMPPYDKKKSITRPTMGIISEYFRNQPNVLRSSHPRASFAAWGKHSKYLTENHSLDFPFGEQSPLARAYELGAYTLMVGTTYDSLNSWYLSAFRLEQSEKKEAVGTETCSAVIMKNQKRIWIEYKDYKRKHDDFERIGEEFEKTEKVKESIIGHSKSKFFSMVDAVDFAFEWMKENR